MTRAGSSGARRRFNPGLLPSIAAVAVFLLFIRLGFWQLERAEQKQILQNDYQNHINAAPVDLGQALQLRAEAERMHWRRCVLSGVYDPQATYLLDNQVMRGVVGYQVFSRVVLEDGASVLVDRGWVAAPETRSETPRLSVPTMPVSLSGVAKPPPVAGIRLGENEPERLSEKLFRVQRLELAQIAAQQDWTLLPYVVRLDAGAPGALTWNGAAPGFNREKHLGYAFQWFILAATVLVIYIVVNTKKREAPGSD